MSWELRASTIKNQDVNISKVLLKKHEVRYYVIPR